MTSPTLSLTDTHSRLRPDTHSLPTTSRHTLPTANRHTPDCVPTSNDDGREFGVVVAATAAVVVRGVMFSDQLRCVMLASPRSFVDMLVVERRRIDDHALPTTSIYLVLAWLYFLCFDLDSSPELFCFIRVSSLPFLIPFALFYTTNTRHMSFLSHRHDPWHSAVTGRDSYGPKESARAVPRVP